MKNRSDLTFSISNLTNRSRPMFGTNGWRAFFSSNAFILVSMLSSSYMAHYNAPKFYWELEDRTQYSKVVWASFICSMLLMTAAVTAGFGTFGGACDSLILNNYAATDSLMSLSRAAVTLSLIFSYPLAFVGVRNGVLDLANVAESKRTPALSDALTLALLAGITGLAFVLKDIRIILSLGGATWGNLLVYVFPAIMLVKAAARHDDLKEKVPLSICTGFLGAIFGVIGTTRAIQSM